MPFPGTPMGRALRRALRQAVASPDFDPSRRRFLRQSAVASLSLTSAALLGPATPWLDPRPAASSPRVAVIGAGIAGLTAAYYLQRAGIRADVFEASERPGGRMYTGQNVVAPGLYTELGGEFIDSNHRDMHRLVQWLDLELIDTRPLIKNLIPDQFFAGGRLHSEREVVEAFRPFSDRVRRDAAVVPGNVSFRTPNVPLDRLSIADYLRRLGVDGWLFELLDVAFTSEMGIDIGEQSALNFITFTNPNLEYGYFEIFGESDERYKVAGGNQRVTDALATRLEGQIQFGRPLTRLRQSADQTFTLSFDQGPEVKADVVVLTLPFTRLRAVELDLELPPVKKTAIDELGYGSNSKVFLGFNRRVWQEQKFAGYLFHPVVQNGWDSSQGQPGPAGGYSILLGGEAGRRFDRSQASRFLPELEGVFPGITAAHNGRAEGFNWPSHPHTQGSYSAYKVGQWTSLAGAEGEPVGNLYFAGEHCSREFQGYMNGGAQTGRLTAQAILRRVKRKAGVVGG